MKDIIHFPLYAFAAAWSYLLVLVWKPAKYVLAPYYRSEFQHRVFVALAQSRLGVKSVVVLALGGPILLGKAWPGMPVWFVHFGLLAIVYMALLNALSRPTGLFHLAILGRGRLAVHMREARGSSDLRKQLLQLADVVRLAKRCNAKELVLDSPLLVKESAKHFLAARLAEFCLAEGITANLDPARPRPLSAAVSGLFAPYRAAYAELGAGRVEWASRRRVMSRRMCFQLS
jgi:hypothetical protein